MKVVVIFLVFVFSVCNAEILEEPNLYEPSRTPIDADANRTMCEIIQSKGYPCQEYYATTEDGYILGMFRMPQPNGAPVLLQHGLLDSSFTWVLNYPEQSFPYILFELGYDVWFGNNRFIKFIYFYYIICILIVYFIEVILILKIIQL